MSELLDRYLAPDFRHALEGRYYARVNEQARLERVMQDPAFWENPRKHVALFSEHGVVHVRDVARQLLTVLERAAGVLIPARPPERLEGFMRGCGVALAYLHDIGMADFSAFGRSMHPEFAAQAVFAPEFDPLLERLWQDDRGGLRRRLEAVAAAGALQQPLPVVLRELLALSLGHSKSSLPVAALNDPQRLRDAMLGVLGVDLPVLYVRKKGGTAGTEGMMPASVRRHYADFAAEAYAWLLSPHPAACELVADVVDTLRALRCADALRQRGTVQKTSGGYEIFISQQTGGAVYALRRGQGELFQLEMEDLFSAGEANIASSELTGEGDLRMSFQRGAYATEAAARQAVAATAFVVQDIRADVLGSFQRPEAGHPQPARMLTLLESTDDNPGFVDQVVAELRRQVPESAARVRIVPSLEGVPALERNRYLTGAGVAWDAARRVQALERLALSGHKAVGVDPELAFEHVRLVTVQAGETLMEGGAPAGFVYIPLEAGLTVAPLGGYASFGVHPWIPIGSTGVVRGSVRNATVTAERSVPVLMIPRDVYLRHWHHTYTADELRQRLL